MTQPLKHWYSARRWAAMAMLSAPWLVHAQTEAQPTALAPPSIVGGTRLLAGEAPFLLHCCNMAKPTPTAPSSVVAR